VHKSNPVEHPPTLVNSGVNGPGLWPSEFEHPVQHVARDNRFILLRATMTCTKSVPHNLFVSEEGVLNCPLSMVAGLFLPTSPSELVDSSNRPVTRL